jgi:hypothetical protein
MSYCVKRQAQSPLIIVQDKTTGNSSDSSCRLIHPHATPSWRYLDFSHYTWSWPLWTTITDVASVRELELASEALLKAKAAQGPAAIASCSCLVDIHVDEHTQHAIRYNNGKQFCAHYSRLQLPPASIPFTKPTFVLHDDLGNPAGVFATHATVMHVYVRKC